MEKKDKLNHYDVHEVIDTFNIEKNKNCELLYQWLDTTGTLTPLEAEFIEQARQRLELKWDEWNEEELKMHFISIIFFVARLDEPKQISTFFERKFLGEVQNIAISLIVDCMIASTTQSGQPKHPYFFLQEFKPSLTDSHDPEGQMLAAMILAQEFNQNGQPLYGCWVQGVVWRFTILTGVEYCVSKTFDASKSSDILQIVFILRNLKDLILNRNN